MYTKEEIVKEIKRVAEKLGVKQLSKQDFMMNSSIPLSTVKYYVGTWDQALSLAKLDSGDSGEIEVNKDLVEDDDLLKELIRLYNETGQEPTAGLINTKGTYSEMYYRAKWKTIPDAFLKAKMKFPERIKRPKDKNEDSVELFLENLDLKKESSVLSDVLMPEPEEDVILPIEVIPSKEEILPVEEILQKEILLPKEETPPKPVQKVQKISVEKPTIKFIPTTIKPAKPPKKKKHLGDSLSFRGLEHAPVNKEGVTFLFGMISVELGYVITSISSDFPSADSRRCVDIAADKWEDVEIEFSFKSSDLKKSTKDYPGCDIIVCWQHDWPDCPLEVLELKSIIKELDNYSVNL